MINNLHVEMRKTFRRVDFYIGLILILMIPILITYDLSSTSPNVSITATGYQETTFTELYSLILGVIQHTGLLVILVVLSCWNTLGKERDKDIYKSLYLLSKSKNAVYTSKLVLLISNSIFYTILFFVTLLGSFNLLSPNGISAAVDINKILISSLGFITHYIFFISAALLGATLRGNIGVFTGTVFLFIFFSILNSYEIYNEYLPIKLLTTGISGSTLSAIGNISIVLVYSIVLLLFSFIIINKTYRRNG